MLVYKKILIVCIVENKVTKLGRKLGDRLRENLCFFKTIIIGNTKSIMYTEKKLYKRIMISLRAW